MEESKGFEPLGAFKFTFSLAKKCHKPCSANFPNGGESGIRTHGPFSRASVFKTDAFYPLSHFSVNIF